jgi:hypothetical protein
MLEAFFGGVFAFAMQVTTKVIHSSIKMIRDELGLGRQSALGNPSSYRRSIEASAANLQEIDDEITDRQRSLARRPNVVDQSAIDDLLEQKNQAYAEYKELQQGAAQAEVTKSPDSFSQSSLVKGAENKLLYHTGLITLKKNCPKCSKPMDFQTFSGSVVGSIHQKISAAILSHFDLPIFHLFTSREYLRSRSRIQIL